MAQTQKVYLGNAFSISMLPMSEEVSVKFKKVGVEEVRDQR